MHCTNCGKEIESTTQFCMHCGAAVGNVQKKPVSRKVGLGFLLIFGVALLAAIASWLLGGVDLMRAVTNWLLGIIFILSVLLIVPGIIVAIINWGKPSAYHHSLARWALGGPPLLIVLTIFSYVILNVIARFLSYN